MTINRREAGVVELIHGGRMEGGMTGRREEEEDCIQHEN